LKDEEKDAARRGRPIEALETNGILHGAFSDHWSSCAKMDNDQAARGNNR
jgi:hypothetical protein